MINKKVSLISLVIIIGIIAVGYTSFNNIYEKSNNPSTVNPSTVNPSTVNPSTVNPSTVNPSTLNPLSQLPSDRLTVDQIIDYNLIEQTTLFETSKKSFFEVYMTPRDFHNIQNLGSEDALDEIRLELKLEYLKLYQLLAANEGTIVIYPTFTSAAYSEPGFYTFFRGDCDESCITDLSFDKPKLGYTSSGISTQVLTLLGYEFVTDVDVDKNPEILKNYDTIILLHNEYVTQKIFDAVVSHPNIIYLFPNALYAEIDVNYDDNTMTLIRGHNYPEFEIKNGFDYEIEQRFHEYEYDSDCLTWEFIKFENGHALTCYPDSMIFADLDILLKMKEL